MARACPALAAELAPRFFARDALNFLREIGISEENEILILRNFRKNNASFILPSSVLSVV
jgi:hypothetical protein